MSFEQTIETIVRRVIREEMRAGPANEFGECLKLADAAKLVNVSVSTLEKWGRAGLTIMKKGGVRRVDAAELRAFMRTKDVEPEIDAKEFAKQLLSNVTPMRRAK